MAKEVEGNGVPVTQVKNGPTAICVIILPSISCTRLGAGIFFAEGAFMSLFLFCHPNIRSPLHLILRLSRNEVRRSSSRSRSSPCWLFPILFLFMLQITPLLFVLALLHRTCFSK